MHELAIRMWDPEYVSTLESLLEKMCVGGSSYTFKAEEKL